jgi:hypothetical protein
LTESKDKLENLQQQQKDIKVEMDGEIEETVAICNKQEETR